VTDIVVPLLLVAVLFLLRAMANEAVKQEYTKWAPALARALVRLAGRVHPARADEWWADVRYLQTAPQPSTGLWEAFSHVCGAPRLAALAVVTAVADVLSRVTALGPRWFERERISMILAAGSVSSSLVVEGWTAAADSIFGMVLVAVGAAGFLQSLVALTLRTAGARKE
jgi:hypothetical protein